MMMVVVVMSKMEGFRATGRQSLSIVCLQESSLACPNSTLANNPLSFRHETESDSSGSLGT